METTTNNKLTIHLIGISNIVIFLAFFFAKIYDKLDLSWWWIFSPLWIPSALVLSIIILFSTFYLFVILFDLISKLWK